MTFSRSVAFSVLGVLALLAAACSGSEGTSIAEGDPAPAASGTAAPTVAVTDGTTPTEPLDPVQTTIGFSRNMFNIDPEPAWVECVIEQSATDPVLEEALRSPLVALGDVDDTQLTSLSGALNGCVDPISLGDWTTQAVGARGPIAEAAPACFAEKYGDEELGDLTFSTIAALTFQFRVDPQGVDPAIDAFSACTPISSLVEFFATVTETDSGFTTVVDRECLAEGVDNREANEIFWGALIEGLVQPVTAIADYIEACTEAFESEFATEVPTDFVPWSGTGALAGVAPTSRANVYTSPPPMTIDPTAEYTAVLKTAGGEIRIRLFADTAPVTVNNFVSLARDGYFDGTVFHRVMADFMAQGGDPSGTGSGGPGYTFEDETDGGPPLDRAGLLAMANSGPDTNGSQFFITVVPTDWLTGNHTVFGEVIVGQDIVDAIELRDPAAPLGRGQVLESVTIE